LYVWLCLEFLVKLPGPFQTAPEEFENGDFIQKTHQTVFGPHYVGGTTIIGHFGFPFEENSVREITRLLGHN